LKFSFLVEGIRDIAGFKKLKVFRGEGFVVWGRGREGIGKPTRAIAPI